MAGELAEKLYQLEENGGKIPNAADCSLTLIEEAIMRNRMAKACCLEPFQKFSQSLSSYQDEYFPSTAEVVSALSEELWNSPDAGEVFEDDPWLSSTHSSWRDFVRIMKENFTNNRPVYSPSITLSRKQWLVLVRATVKPNASHHDISNCFPK